MMTTPETQRETSIFRSWGSLRRVDTLGNRIDYAATAPTSLVKIDAFIEPDGNPHRNGFHSNGVNGAGAKIDLLTGEGIL